MTAIIKRIDGRQNKIDKKSDYNNNKIFITKPQLKFYLQSTYCYYNCLFIFFSLKFMSVKKYSFVHVVNYLLFIVIPLIVWQYLWHKGF